MIKVKNINKREFNEIKIKNASKEKQKIIRTLYYLLKENKILMKEKLKIKDMKHFVLETENKLLELTTNQIYPTKRIIQQYPETFGKYGEIKALYEEEKVPDLRRIYFPYIEKIRKIKKSYLFDLKEIIKLENKLEKINFDIKKFDTKIDELFFIAAEDFYELEKKIA